MIYVAFWRDSPVEYSIMKVKVFDLIFTHTTEYDKPPLIADPEQVGAVVAREAVEALYANPIDQDTWKPLDLAKLERLINEDIFNVKCIQRMCFKDWTSNYA